MKISGAKGKVFGGKGKVFKVKGKVPGVKGGWIKGKINMVEGQ